MSKDKKKSDKKENSKKKDSKSKQMGKDSNKGIAKAKPGLDINPHG